jgi:plastocyanin
MVRHAQTSGVNRRTLLATLGTGSLAGLAGCSSVLGFGNSPCRGAACDIGMRRNAFVPATHEVGVGDTVVWRNTSGADHTVTAYGDAIPEAAAFFATGGYENEQRAREAWQTSRGGRLGPRDTFEHTFEIPGTYNYVCIPHERAGMTGTVVVSE